MDTLRIPPPLVQAGLDYVPVKNWDFGHNIRDGNELREEFWTRYGGALGTLDYLNDEWQRYRDNDNHCFNADSLSLVARAPTDTLAVGKIESGMIRSKASFLYGYIEGRFRMPKGRGMWPAFWFIPASLHWPPEIDIFEVVNNGRDTTRNSFHGIRNADVETMGTSAGALAVVTYKESIVLQSKVDQWASYRPAFDYSEGFHTFGLLWTSYSASWFVDNVLVREVDVDWRDKRGNPAGPAQIIANLAVGGAWPEPPNNLADFPARLDIDYIRVWQPRK